MKENELILILDFFGQYNQLIARRVRECNVYCEIVPYNISVEEIIKKNPKGIIFTGGPSSVYVEDAKMCEKKIFDLGIPILGICYGMQLMTYVMGGKVTKANVREYGVLPVEIDSESLLFKNFNNTNNCLMSHTDFVSELPEGFKVIAKTESCPIAAMENQKRKFYGIQFHPEVNDTVAGIDIIRNFLFEVCNCTRRLENVFFCGRVNKNTKRENW